MNAVMDERVAASRFRNNAKCRLTSLLNVAEALFAAGNGSHVDKNELVALKETFIHACDRYVDTHAEDELTEEVNAQLSIYVSEQLQFFIRIIRLFNTPNVTKNDIGPGANDIYAEEVPHADPPRYRSWYLPHHHVYSPAKPAKVRVVFDCSVRSRGSSLNDRAYQGPKLTTLLNVVLLCIIYSCVISGDVQAMYNQVKVPVGDRDMMRFLWNGRAYRKTSHLFGDR